MSFASLPVILYVLPLFFLFTAISHPFWKQDALAVGGLAVVYMTGGYPALILLGLSVSLTWLILRLSPRKADGHLHRAELWLYVGVGLQALILLLGRILLGNQPLLPLFICLPGREDYEIIAVDDGSPDRSGQIAEEYAARYPGMIRVIHQPNGGLGAARNTGIDSAKGEFLLFLDSDDSLFPGALEEMLRELERDDGCDVIFFNDDQVDENGQLLSHSVSCAREGVFTLEEYPGLLLELPSACTKLWRRRLFLESGIRFPVRLWFEDLATTPRLYLRAGKMRAVPRAWLRYLLRQDSITNAKDPSRNREIITALSLVREDYRQQGALKRYEKELEISAVKHQLLFSTVRVNQMDPRSPLQKELKQNLDKSWPRWRSNPYLSQLPLQHRLLLKLIDGGHYAAVHAMMAANDRIKGKNR